MMEATNAEIKKTVSEKFGVKFPILEKCDVNGPNAHDVFKWLRSNTKEL